MKKITGLLSIILALFFFAVSPALAGDAPGAFKKCKACHKVNKDNSFWSVGPGLMGVGKRTSREYLEKSLKDPQGLFEAGGPEIEALKQGAKFKSKLKMPKAVKKLTDDDVKAIVDYLMTL